LNNQLSDFRRESKEGNSKGDHDNEDSILFYYDVKNTHRGSDKKPSLF
jgi:hypothetical protein